MRKFFIIFALVLLFTVTSCQDIPTDIPTQGIPNEETAYNVLAPVFETSPNAVRSIQKDASAVECGAFYNEWCKPVISSFTAKSLKENEKYQVYICGKAFDVSFTVLSQNIYEYIVGSDSDEDVFVKVVFDSSTNTFSYFQGIRSIIPNYKDGKDFEYVTCVVGESMQVKDDGSIQGLVLAQLMDLTLMYGCQVNICKSEYYIDGVTTGVLFSEVLMINSDTDINIDRLSFDNDFSVLFDNMSNIYMNNTGNFRDDLKYVLYFMDIETKNGMGLSYLFDTREEAITFINSESTLSKWVLV